MAGAKHDLFCWEHQCFAHKTGFVAVGLNQTRELLWKKKRNKKDIRPAVFEFYFERLKTQKEKPLAVILPPKWWVALAFSKQHCPMWRSLYFRCLQQHLWPGWSLTVLGLVSAQSCLQSLPPSAALKPAAVEPSAPSIWPTESKYLPNIGSATPACQTLLQLHFCTREAHKLYMQCATETLERL